MEKKFYFISNNGCDDTTYGLYELTQPELEFLMNFIENLNKASTYGCQPTITIKEVEKELFKPWDEEAEENYREKFYFNNRPYCFKDGYNIWNLDKAVEKIKLNGIENNKMPF